MRHSSVRDYLRPRPRRWQRSGRGWVQAELDRNGGVPRPTITDFSNDSPSTVGPNGDFSTGTLPSHVRLIQRGVKLVENAANLGALAQLRHPEKCTLFVGAPKHVRGTGGPSRVIASCKKSKKRKKSKKGK